MFYWEERTLTFDNAFQIFLMICDHRIEIMADRWPAASARFLPMLAVKMGFSIKAIAIIFSLSYVLVQYCFFFLTAHILKQKRLGYLLLAVMLLATSEGFYWCNSEQIHGLSASILLLASLRSWENHHRKILSLALACLSFFMVLFYHPLLLFPTFFLLVYNQLNVGFQDRKTLLFLVSFVAVWFCKRQWLPNWYDNGKSAQFKQSMDTWLTRFFEMPSVDYFMGEWWSKYHFLVLGFLVVSYLLIHRKEWLQLLFIYASCVIYLGVVLIGNPVPVNSFYVEINFYALVVFLFYPILLIVKKELLETNWFVGLFSALLFVSMLRILVFSAAFQERVKWVNNTLSHQACAKVLVNEKDIPKEVKMLTWSLPYESLLLSQQKGRITTLHWKNESFLNEGKYTADQWVTDFNSLDSQYIDNVYFDWPSGEYCAMNSLKASQSID